MSYMRAQYVSTSCSCTWTQRSSSGANFKWRLSRLAWSTPVWSGRASHELYKCFGPQLEHFCLTVRMIYVRRLFVQRVIERDSERTSEREREVARAVRTSGGISDLSFCSAQRVLNATACVHSEIAETKARGGGRRRRWEEEGGRK